MAKYRIAVIPGDGIGKEVVPEGIDVLEAVGGKFGIEFEWDEFDWSCERYHSVGTMMPEDGLDRIRGHHCGNDGPGFNDQRGSRLRRRSKGCRFFGAVLQVGICGRSL